MRIIGIDPGSVVTGFGLVEGNPGPPRHLTAGTIRPNPHSDRPSKLRTIFDRLSDLIAEYAPDALSLERSFVGDNVQSAFRLGEARAMPILAAARREIPLL